MCMAREGGHDIAGMPAGLQHFLVVPQQARPGAGVRVQWQVAAQDDSLAICCGCPQRLSQPAHLRITGASSKLHKAPLRALHAFRAVLLLRVKHNSVMAALMSSQHSHIYKR